MLLVLVALVAPATPSAEAHHARRLYRIGVLEIVDAAANGPNLGAFRERLAEIGYVEGHDVVIEYRSADGRAERLPDLATELVRLKVDVIVARGTRAALSAQAATLTIPIVMASSGDPVSEGIVASLARPGGNITGFHVMAPPELGGRRLRLLREVVPASSRVGVISNSADILSPFIVRETEKVARMLGVQLKHLDVQRPEGFEPAFEAALMDQVDALIAVEDSLTFADRTKIVGFAAMSRLPAVYGLREYVEAGGLMSYGTDRRDLFRRSATYVHRILRGTRPSELPIEAPVKFELALNLKTAETLRLTIPPSLLSRADYVVR